MRISKLIVPMIVAAGLIGAGSAIAKPTHAVSSSVVGGGHAHAATTAPHGGKHLSSANGGKGKSKSK